MYQSKFFLQNGIDFAFSLRYIYRESIFDDRDKILFIHVPKNASTSLQSLLLEYMGALPENYGFKQLKSSVFNNSLKEKTRNIADAFLAIRNSFVFSVMRDPIKRFVSAHNMILDRPGYKAEMEKNLGKPLNSSNNVDDLIDYLYSTRFPDWHFRPQSVFLSAAQNVTILPMDAVKIQKSLSDAGRCGDWVSDFCKRVRNRGNSNPIEFSSKQLGKLTDFYRSDFELSEKHGIEFS